MCKTFNVTLSVDTTGLVPELSLDGTPADWGTFWELLVVDMKPSGVQASLELGFDASCDTMSLGPADEIESTFCED